MLQLLTTILLLSLSYNSIAQNFEGKIVFDAFERFEDPDEIVPEDSIIMYVKGSSIYVQSFGFGQLFYFGLLRNDTLFEYDSSNEVIRYQVIDKNNPKYKMGLAVGKENRTNQEGHLVTDALTNEYFVKYDSSITLPFYIYPLEANNLPYLPSYCHLNIATYTHKIVSTQKQKLDDSLFQIPVGMKIIHNNAIIPPKFEDLPGGELNTVLEKD